MSEKIKNKLTLKWMDERKVSQGDIEGILGTASPDCHEANLIVEWGIHAIEAIEALESELSHYAHLAGGESAPKAKPVSFDDWAEQAREAVMHMEAIHELSHNGSI